MRNLSEKLFEWTQKRWVITLAKEKGIKNYLELQSIKKNEIMEKEKQGEVFKKFKEVFADGELVDISKKD